MSNRYPAPPSPNDPRRARSQSLAAGVTRSDTQQTYWGATEQSQSFVPKPQAPSVPLVTPRRRLQSPDSQLERPMHPTMTRHDSDLVLDSRSRRRSVSTSVATGSPPPPTASRDR